MQLANKAAYNDPSNADRLLPIEDARLSRCVPARFWVVLTLATLGAALGIWGNMFARFMLVAGSNPVSGDIEAGPSWAVPLVGLAVTLIVAAALTAFGVWAARCCRDDWATRVFAISGVLLFSATIVAGYLAVMAWDAAFNGMDWCGCGDTRRWDGDAWRAAYAFLGCALAEFVAMLVAIVGIAGRSGWKSAA